MVNGGQQGMEALGRAIAELETFVADPSKLQQDEHLRQGMKPINTIVVGAIAALSVAMIIWGAITRDSDLQIILMVFGFLCALVFGIGTLVSWAHDHGAKRIQDASKPAKVFKRFWTSVRTGRGHYAYLSLVPTSRNVGPVPPLDLGRIPVSDKPQQIVDSASFKKYWKSVFKGTSSHTRSVQLLKVKKIQDLPADVTVVEATVRFTSYASAMALIFGPLILVLISKKETKKIRKLLVRRCNKWFFLSGELSGALDQLGEAAS